MKRVPRKTLAALWAVFALGLAAASPAQGAAGAGRPLVTGVTGLFEVGDPTAMQHIKASGSSFVRIPIDWHSVAPSRQPASWNPENPGDPNYHWSAVDTAVSNAVANGLEPLLMVYKSPSWANGCPPRTDALNGEPCEPSPAALASFAAAAARRYSGSFQGLPRVRYWQALNEPNLSLYLGPQYAANGSPASPDMYRALIDSFYAAIKSVDPADLVVLGGLAPLSIPGPAVTSIGPMEFTRLLLCMKGRRNPKPAAGDCGGGVHFDIFDIHPYTTGGPTHKGGPDEVEMGDLGKLQRLLAAADRAGRIKGVYKRTPLWITEMGWNSNPPSPGGLSMAIETRWTAEALYVAWKAGVSHFFWFLLRDGGNGNSSGLYLKGATTAEDHPKPYFYAFRFPFVAYPGHKKGLTFWGRTPNSKRGKVTIQVLKGGRWRSAAVTRANSVGIFSGSIATRYGSTKHGSARALFAGQASVPFSMKPVPDFYQPPFG